MISRALDAGMPAAWVAGDEVYGADPGLRAAMEHRQTGYVLAIAAATRLATPAGRRDAPADRRRLAQDAPGSATPPGTGSKGQRYYDWAWTVIDRDKPGRHWLLIRRHHRTGETGLLPLLRPRPASRCRPGASRRAAMDHRGELPGRQDPHRTGPAPGPELDLLAPLDHPGHARPCVPDHYRRRARPPASTSRADPTDPQRNSPAPHRPGDPASPRHRPPAPMVPLAAAPPAPRQDQPLPAPSPRTMNVTKSGCRTRRSSCSLFAFGGADCHARGLRAVSPPPLAVSCQCLAGRLSRLRGRLSLRAV